MVPDENNVPVTESVPETVEGPPPVHVAETPEQARDRYRAALAEISAKRGMSLEHPGLKTRAFRYQREGLRMGSHAAFELCAEIADRALKGGV